ncbi:MAG: hypothetical protein HN350_15045 [Phycisphaerales bacterium]|jgi:hypothetical protein|nr:hypothetical protein [Phycisphaerales bacterium]
MSELRPKTLRLIWLMIAALLFTGAWAVNRPLDRISREYELVPSGNAALANNPKLAVLQVAPGGLRSLMINYFWIRSQTLHREGRHFDAMQLSELICDLQPRFPGVWQFQAWQLAWNISATAHTPIERWNWVKASIDLLRDKGIAMNPNALLLYKQLGWTFLSKMGSDTDDMHWYYKQVWAREFQELLGAPTLLTHEELLAKFKLIADSPLDKTRSKTEDIQEDKRQSLIDDNPDVAALDQALAGVGLKIDASLLKAYNYQTRDEAVDITRSESTESRDKRLTKAVNAIKDPTEKARHLATLEKRAKWAEVINDPAHGEGLKKALAFVRAQTLWGVHKMDPDYMYGLMERFGPIDWRTVWSHGLYWSIYGTEHCKDVERVEMDALNTDRTLLSCLKTLTWQGKMDYFAPRSGLVGEDSEPTVNFRSDWRFIKATHEEYVKLGKERSTLKHEKYSQNPLNTGHMNYLSSAITTLYLRNRRDDAKKYFQWVKTNYEEMADKTWNAENIDDFIVASMKDRGSLIPRVATAHLTASLQMGMIWLAQGDDENAGRNLNYARRIYDEYHNSEETRAYRLALPPLNLIAANILTELLVRPKLLDANLSIEQRSVMYTSMEHRWPEATAIVYDLVRGHLTRQCQAEKLDFNILFPPPSGLEAVRQYRSQQNRRQ